MKTGITKNSYVICTINQQCATRFKYCLCTGILFTITLLLLGTSQAANNKQQLEAVQYSILTTKKSTQQHQKQRTILLNQLKQQEQSIARSFRVLQDTQRTLEILHHDIERLTRSIHQLQNRQNAQQKFLAQQLDTAFRQGKRSWLQLILSNTESIRNERILVYFNHLNKVREKTISDLRQISTNLEIQKHEQQHKQQQKQQILKQQQQQQQTLQSTRAAYQKTINRLNLSISEDRRRLANLYQNETRLRTTIAYVEREAQKKSYSSTYQYSINKRMLTTRTGGLGRSVRQAFWPVQGRTLHNFGEPQQGELRYKGLVIAALEGSKVKSIAAGQVLMADWLQGYGLIIIIEHGKGDMSLYGYNQNVLVSVGDQVKAGQPIAIIGSSGGYGTPALYFEIRRQGQAVNPMHWLGR